MNKDKPFDLHKGGRHHQQEFGSGHQFEKPADPAIRVRERADKSRDPLEFETPVMKGKNYSRHLHKPAAAEAIPPRNPEEIESNQWRNSSDGQGGINDIKDDAAGKAGVHQHQPPPEHNLDFLKGFRGKKP